MSMVGYPACAQEARAPEEASALPDVAEVSDEDAIESPLVDDASEDGLPEFPAVGEAFREAADEDTPGAAAEVSTPEDDDEPFSVAPTEEGVEPAGPEEHVSVEGPFERPVVEQTAAEDWWAEVIKFDNGLKLSSAEALHWRSPNKRVRMRLGGRIHWDLTSANDDGLGRSGYSVESGQQLRRARIYVEGDIDKRLDFRADIDFAGSGTSLRDFYLRFRKLPVVGNLKFGYFKEPFGLDLLTSSNNSTFLERGLPTTFAPIRNWGAMAHSAAFESRMTWAVGVFQSWHNDGDLIWGRAGQGDATAVTGRVTFLPYYENGGRRRATAGARRDGL